MILVMDDNREYCVGMRLVLEDKSFQVATAPDVESALGILRAERPGLILADLKLPGVDGDALLGEMKRTPEWRHIPFVFVTAAAGWGEAARARAMGADGYIVKPFDLEGLLGVVERLYGGSGVAAGAGVESPGYSYQMDRKDRSEES